MTSGLVLNIQRFTLHDGPGIRTTVFLKGCALGCVWCHNPEAMNPQPETTAAGRTYGTAMTVEAVLAEVEKDSAYYHNSGGGMTLSGGEPLFQFAFARELLHTAKRRGLHVVVDTAGYVPRRYFEQVLPDVDLFLFDIKADSSALHRRLTGVSNTRILANLDFLMAEGAAVRLRCPLIPGVNDHPAHLTFIADLAARYPGLRGIELMPFHNMAAGKWAAVGKVWTLGDRPSASTDDHSRWLAALQAAGCTQAQIG